MQLNVNGIRSRKIELDHRLATDKPHIVCLQETKLKPNMSAPRFAGYNTAARQDRSLDSPGGGVIILVRDDMSYEPITNPYCASNSDPYTDCTAIKIHPLKIPPFTVINLYSPPPRWIQDQTPQLQRLDITALKTFPRMIITADLNAHGSWDPHQPSDQLGSLIDDWSSDNNLFILNNGSHTRINPATGANPPQMLQFPHLI